MKKKKIIITGASNGIGYQLALKLTALGHDVFATARSIDKLKSLAEVHASTGCTGSLTIYSFDIEELLKGNKSLFDTIQNFSPEVDILINNAGYLSACHFIDNTIEAAYKVFNVNFFSAAELIRQVSPLLTTGSHVVNIGSMGGFQGSAKFKGLAYYSASKSALSTLTECLAVEYAEESVSFNCLALGATDTEMLKKAFPDYKAPVTASEMADFIATFALTANKLLNGQTIPVTLSTP